MGRAANTAGGITHRWKVRGAGFPKGRGAVPRVGGAGPRGGEAGPRGRGAVPRGQRTSCSHQGGGHTLPPRPHPRHVVPTHTHETLPPHPPNTIPPPPPPDTFSPIPRHPTSPPPTPYPSTLPAPPLSSAYRTRTSAPCMSDHHAWPPPPCPPPPAYRTITPDTGHEVAHQLAHALAVAAQANARNPNFRSPWSVEAAANNPNPVRMCGGCTQAEGEA